MSNSFSVRFILKKYKEKNGKAPLYIRLTHSGKHCDNSLKRLIPLEKWNENQRVSGTSMEVRTLNRYLDLLYNKAFEIFEKLQLKDEFISAEIIRNKLFNLEEEEGITLLSASKYHYNQNKDNFSSGTLKHYLVTERYFGRFLTAKMKLSDWPGKRRL
jgi:integrase/recombinase XerD